MLLLPSHVEDMGTGECLEPHGVCVLPGLQTLPQGPGPGGVYQFSDKSMNAVCHGAVNPPASWRRHRLHPSSYSECS